MSITPIKRKELQHYISTSFKKRGVEYVPEWHLVNEGVTDLSEDFNADEEDLQYIAEENATHVVKRYAPSITLSAVMVDGDPVNEWIRKVINELPVGEEAETAYIRFNTLDKVTSGDIVTTYPEGQYNCYKAFKRSAVVSVSSFGGAAGDNIGMECTISGKGDVVNGYIVINKDGTFHEFKAEDTSTLRTVSINVKDSDGAVKGASVIFNGEIKNTDDDGAVKYSVNDGTYPYSIFDSKHQPVSTNISITKESAANAITETLTKKS